MSHFFKMSTGSNGDTAVPSNPNPYRYRITDEHHNLSVNAFALRVNYPDCKNYEGNKILVFEGTTLLELRSQGNIDPHFSDNDLYVSPIARFVPTKEGWEMACNLVDSF